MRTLVQTTKEIHGRLPEGFLVKGVQLFGDIVVTELLTVQVAGAQQISEAGIPLVVAVGGVVADGAADLVGLVVAAEHGPGRHAHGAVHLDALLHQDIQNTGGEHAPHGTAFQDQSGFHNGDTPSFLRCAAVFHRRLQRTDKGTAFRARNVRGPPRGCCFQYTQILPKNKRENAEKTLQTGI